MNGMLGGGGGGFKVPELQADATLTQANPVSGTKYAVIATNNNVRLRAAYANVTWTVQPTPLELHFTVDGQALTMTQVDPVSTTVYLASQGSGANFVAETNEYANRLSYLIEGRSFKLEAETTGGTVSQLYAFAKWSKW